MKMLTLYFSLVYMLVSLTTHVSAQFYSAGQDPASVKWMQINTPNVQVIFPSGYEEEASYITDVLEWSYEHITQSLQHLPRKVSVIVHTHTVVSNGFVSWAPSRVELYATAPSDNDHHDWMERLIIHEYRHVVQIDKLNQGLTRLLGILFGEMGIGAVVGHIPLWFLEGDAVFTETEFTKAGRGRLPRFEQGLRAQVLNKGIFSYDKANFGSFKHHVPNHYELGYQLVAAARAEKGATIWSPVINNVARRPWAFFPFSSGLRKQMGVGIKTFYQNTFEMLDSAWTAQKNKEEYTPALSISPEEKLFTNYHYPLWNNDTTIVALKSSLNDIAHFVTISLDGTVEVLFAPGNIFPNSVDYANGKLIWSEFRPDPRWEHRSYAEIMVYDFETQTRSRFSNKGKYFSPALSPDGNTVAAVESDHEGNNALVLLKADSGGEICRYQYPDNDFIMQPAWHPGGEKIALVVLDDQGKRLDEINIREYTTTNLMVAEEHDISSPSYLGDDILINSTWSGIDNIFLVHPTGQIRRVISSEFGAVNAKANKDKIVYSDYTANGYRINMLQVTTLRGIPIEEVENNSVALYKRSISTKENIPATANIPRNEYTAKPYSRLASLFLLHSWFPAYFNINNREVNPGVSLLFQNKLSTSFATLGYLWDMNEETGKFKASYTYKGWYPVTEINAETGDRKFFYAIGEEVYSFMFKENTSSISFSIPLSYQKNQYFRGITPLLRLGISQTAESPNTPDSIFVGRETWYNFAQTTFYRQEYRLLAYNQRRSVMRDIFPRSGQIIDINYRHTPFGEHEMGRVFAARGIAYLPGLARHQGIRLSVGYQSRKAGENLREPGLFNIFYNFGNILSYPRGTSGHHHQTLSTFTADYAFPLIYPDLSIPYLIYLKRLKGYLFYDFARGQRFPNQDNNVVINESIFSYGLGLSGDMHLFRLFAPVSLGVQVAFPMGESVAFQMIYGVSL